MPRPVASAVLFLGLAVLAFGGILAFVIPEAGDDEPQPRATLLPFDEDEVPPAATRAGDIHGLVSTPDGQAVGNVVVALVPMFEEEGVEARATTTAGDGSFFFAEVDVNPGSPWVVEAHYDDAPFPSPVLRAPTTADDPLEIVVAETTTEATDLEVRIESLAIVGDSAGLQAIHAIGIRNHSDLAYAGPLPLPLLPGATAIQEGAGLDRRHLELLPGTMTSLTPVLPGEHDVTYTYIAQMPTDGMSLERRTFLPTARYELLVTGELEAGGLQGLSEEGEVRLGPQGQERTYLRYLATDLDEGAELRALIKVGTDDGLLRVAAPVAAVVVALALILLPLLLRRRRASAVEPSEPTVTPTAT